MKMCNVLFIKDLPPPTRKFKNRWLSTGLNQINKCKNYLKIILLIFLITGFGYNVNAQKNTEERKQLFEKEMNAYITTHLNEEIAEIKQNTDLIENFDEYTEEDIRSMAKENTKDKYIRRNMKEYLNTYFSNPQAMVTTDTFVCDNGGFEDDFLYYKGYTSTYHHGSNDCTPVDASGNDIVYTLATLPTPRRFEIVTSGADDLTGIQRVKFGNKALKINDRHGHINYCRGDLGVDKIVKRFKVTDTNRDFTIWYSVALENPASHENRQPFLNIKCDRAPDNELCFDADIIKCAQYFSDPCAYDSIDVLDWSCHRFKIPKEYIDSIATLEITVADCGKSAHFGYAYIDGICEECDSSALGSATLDDINYASCNAVKARVCGTYTPPTICSNGGTWVPVEITVPGYNITNISIDTSTKTFCFDFPVSNFTNEDCLEIYAELTFNNGVFDLPEVLTNSIDICKSLYQQIIDVNNLVIGDCQDNNTSDNISDDYYYIYIDVSAQSGVTWTLERELEDPYPNENNTHTIETGTGNTSVILGPFLIQEGDWWLLFTSIDCYEELFIDAPDYCSGCDKFYETEIGNVQCSQNGSWQFDLYIPGNTGQYSLVNTNGGFGSDNYYYGMLNHIPTTPPFIPLNYNCREYTLTDVINQSCTSQFTICPPKPCDDDCDLQVEADVECYTDDYGNDYFYVNLDVSGAGQDQHYCYSTMEAPYANNPSPNTTSGTPLIYNPITGSYTIGFFTADIYLTVYLCDDGVDCSQNCRDCFKTIYIPNPDCERQKEIERGGKGKKLVFHNNNWINNKTYEELGKLIIVPNPFADNTIVFKSNMKTTEFEIYNSSGQLIKAGNFKGNEYKLKLNVSQGLYFIRYTGDNGMHGFVKIIKL